MKYTFFPDTKASENVEAIITQKGFVNDVGKLSTFYQTSAFHSVVINCIFILWNDCHAYNLIINQFQLHACTIRLHLAALHYNENCKRDHAKTMDGVPTFPKYKKGGHVVKKVVEEQTFSKLLLSYYELYPICV